MNEMYILIPIDFYCKEVVEEIKKDLMKAEIDYKVVSIK